MNRHNGPSPRKFTSRRRNRRTNRGVIDLIRARTLKVDAIA